MFVRTVAFAACALLPAPLIAQDATLAKDGLAARIETLSASAVENGFELGAMLTLRAVEKSLQTRYDYGLGDRVAQMPLLRLSIGQRPSPNPKTPGPDALANIVTTFLADMQSARAVLEAAADGDARTFELTPQDLWFDVNRNTRRDPGEDAIDILAPALLGTRTAIEMKKPGSEIGPLVVRFDNADHAWLTAYTHMLSGFGNLFMAFDATPILADLAQRRAAVANAPTIPNTYDVADLLAEKTALEKEMAEARQREKALSAQIKPLNDKSNDLQRAMRKAETKAEKDALRAEQIPIQDQIKPLRAEQNNARRATRNIRNEIRALDSKIPTSAQRRPARRGDMAGEFLPTADAIYVVIAALRQQPDAARLHAARDHWREMIAQNTLFWDAVAQETDNENEWIPNPNQTAALPVTLDPRAGEAWQRVLSDANDVLEGRLLIPHPLLPGDTGFSLAAYLENPSPVDIVEFIHGVGLYRYAANGPKITAQSWSAFGRMTNGRAGAFALMFN